MSPFFAVFLVLLLASSSYAAGRLHGQLSYRIGYRFGYRQGYFDGDRGAWSRRQTRTAITSMPSAEAVPVATAGAPLAGTPPLAAPAPAPAPVPVPVERPTAPVTAAARQGTTYTGASFAGGAGPTGGAAGTGTAGSGRHAREVLVGRRP
ncbi:hypothetical protein [Solwaraspora sp. WMMA2101]|uniref:hypothetical protein n=1 Tax=Solwaraspora sp. WMMA2101 TaxID=3404124 RepID=UPI003B9446E3